MLPCFHDIHLIVCQWLTHYQECDCVDPRVCCRQSKLSQMRNSPSQRLACSLESFHPALCWSLNFQLWSRPIIKHSASALQLHTQGALDWLSLALIYRARSTYDRSLVTLQGQSIVYERVACDRHDQCLLNACLPWRYVTTSAGMSQGMSYGL